MCSSESEYQDSAPFLVMVLPLLIAHLLLILYVRSSIDYGTIFCEIHIKSNLIVEVFFRTFFYCTVHTYEWN